MLGKITRPPVISGDRSGFPDGLSSPKSPLDFKIRSPRGMKNCDVGGVGLAIVAALEKSCTGVAAGVPVKLIVGNLNFNRSEPIPICSSSAAKNSSAKCGRVAVAEECSDEMDYGESYTYVTCHRPNKESFTRVYCDDGGEDQDCDDQMRNFDNSRLKNLGVFYESPPPRVTAAAPAFPTSDFLSSCHLCRKKLHGKDIYMYRGEKAFCSTECRHRQIVKDERKEKCRTEFSRYGEISVSPYSGGQLFSTGIFAT